MPHVGLNNRIIGYILALTKNLLVKHTRKKSPKEEEWEGEKVEGEERDNRRRKDRKKRMRKKKRRRKLKRQKYIKMLISRNGTLGQGKRKCRKTIQGMASHPTGWSPGTNWSFHHVFQAIFHENPPFHVFLLTPPCL